MISIWKMIYDLEYWIHIQTANDIVDCPGNRQEYQHLVQEQKDLKIEPEYIPGKVLIRLKQEADIPWYKRRTFWICLKLWITRKIR